MVPRLTDFIEENPGNGFHAVPQYFETGDFLTYFIKDTPHYAERLNEMLTVYLDMTTKELVGVKVKGVRHILKTANELEILVGDDTVKLSVFLFASAAVDRTSKNHQRYAQLATLKDVRVSRELLPTA